MNSVYAQIRVMSENGTISTVNLEKCIYFNLDKERYTPYISFRGAFIIPQYYEEVISIKFFIDDNEIHYGSIDMAKMTLIRGYYRLDIVSRSYTLALGLNQPKPQINTSVSLSNLLSRNVTLTNISCETGTKTVNYIYVLENSTLWDAVVAYSLKAYGTYPFVYKTNEIRVNAPSEAVSRTYVQSSIVEKYNGSSQSNLISHIHMKDTDGNYETYNLTDNYAVSRDIIRHKQIPLDNQWLADTDMALTSRVNYAKRAAKYRGMKVLGYSGEELFDKFTNQNGSPEFSSSVIHRLNITGSNNVIYTTMYEYIDAY